MDDASIAIIVGAALTSTVPALIAAYSSVRTRKENSSQHGMSQDVIRSLTDEVRKNGEIISEVHAMAKAASYETRIRNRAALSFTSELWFETDSAGHCVWVNNSWLKYAGMLQGEALGTGWGNAIHDEDSGELFEAWDYAVGHGFDFGPYEFRFKNGSLVSSEASPMFAGDESVIGYIGRAVVLSTPQEETNDH